MGLKDLWRRRETEAPTAPPGKCPQCGASTSRQEQSSGFGPLESRQTLCGACGYEYPKANPVGR